MCERNFISLENRKTDFFPRLFHPVTDEYDVNRKKESGGTLADYRECKSTRERDAI